MNTIDLHVHSNASDGSLTPSEVVSQANEAGLSYFALTDHDTVDGIEEALLASRNLPNLTLIPGIELSCYYGEREFHIVGLFIDYKDPAFLNELKKLKQAREKRNMDMVQLFVDNGIHITMEDLLHGNPESVITRAHFARVLVEKGVCKNKQEAFDKYLDIGCPFYLPKPKITPEYVIGLIKSVNGTAILAHPLSYNYDLTQMSKILDETLIPCGLDGMECYYSTYDLGQTQALRSLALSKKLLVSGGSDFHGIVKPDISIGTGRGNLCISQTILDTMLEARAAKDNQNH